MNKNKIKRIYQPSYELEEIEDWRNDYYLRKYNKTLIEYLISKNRLRPDQVIDENSYWEEYHNLIPYFRGKKNYTLLLRHNATCKEFGVKQIPSETIIEYDAWQDDKVGSYNERKSWKRNSKRPHQWKEK